MKFFNYNSGQSLIEILIAIFIGAILIISSSAAIVLMLKKNLEVKEFQPAVSLMQELVDDIRVISKSDWNSVYNLTKGQSTHYYVDSSGDTLSIESGEESFLINDKNFTRYFFVENVNRGTCGVGNVATGTVSSCNLFVASEILEDPSTQKITAFVEWNGGHSINIVQYLIRSRDLVFVQTDWTGGAVSNEIVSTSTNKFSTSTNIDFSTTSGSMVLSGGSASGTLISSIFNTQRINGAAFNSFLWQGGLGDGAVKFRIASSDSSSGPWNYYGWDGSASAYYPVSGSASPDASIVIMPEHHNNDRYIRYKVFLTQISNSPQINDIIINWSP